MTDQAVETKDAPAKVEQIVVCAGYAPLTDGTKGVVFHRVKGGKVQEGERIFKAKGAFRNLMVGGLYRVTGDEDLSSINIAAKWEGSLDDVATVAAWRAKTRAFEVDRKRKADERTAKKIDALRDLLKPLRNEWIRSDGVGRLAIEVQVLAALRGMK